VVEVALMAPWIFFLFVGVFDVGFFCYAAICTQNAARAVALSYAQSSTVTPCNVALGELTMLPNVNGGSCNALPVQVAVTKLNGSACADSATTSGLLYATTPFCVQSSVTYQTIPLIPIPGIMTGRMTLTRKAEMRLME